MPKAIKITTGNVGMLASRYSIMDEDKTELLPVGYWLVTDFGEDNPDYDVLTNGMFVTNFNLTGVTLENGFVEVERD
jgi:hypothetical protein